MPRRRFRPLSILKSKKLLYPLGCIVGLFVLLNYVLLPAYVHRGGTLSVPKVVGMPLQEAKALLESNGLEPVEGDTRPDPRAPVGSVVHQNPPPDAVVKPGRRVYLSVSGGEPVVTVPLLRGRSTRDAKFALERYGLKMGKIEYATSDSYHENTIMEQSVPSGQRVPKGSAVHVVVSRGKARANVNVPSVVGKTVSEAEKSLAAAGFKVGNITYQASFDLLPNTIVDQFPRAGETVPYGQAIDLFVVSVEKPKDEFEVRRN